MNEKSKIYFHKMLNLISIQLFRIINIKIVENDAINVVNNSNLSFHNVSRRQMLLDEFYIAP